jgi:hypothetical protein
LLLGENLLWLEATQVPFHITRTGDPSRLKAHEEGVRENQRGSEEIEVPAVIFQWKMEAERRNCCEPKIHSNS